MKFNAFPLLLLTFLTSYWALSQNLTITGVVNDASNAPVSYANVVLYGADHAEILGGSSTDDFGGFIISDLDEGEYFIDVTFMGYHTFSKNVILSQNTDIGIITLEENTESLDEVNIVFNKPTIKKEADRLVFNIENTAISEGNMLQAVKSTPGVLVMDGNIQVKSASPTIYINNRKVELNADELAQLLEGTPASAIKSIEVITNPPASYDASSGVVINIQMAKNLITGFRGGIFGNYTQGVYPRYQGGADAYFKTDKVNFFANYSYTHDKINRRNEDGINYLNSDGETYEIWNSDVDRNTKSKSHNVNFNFDYYLDDHNTLSLSSNLLFTPFFNYYIDNRTNILDEQEDFQSSFLAMNETNDDKYNLGFDFGYKHIFKNNNASLSFNSHYTAYDYQRNQESESHYFNSSNQATAFTAFSTKANQNTDIFTAQLDYILPLGETAELDLGAKFSNVQTDSDISRFNFLMNDPVLDNDNSNMFNYHEKVYAAYANYSKEWEKWSLNAGIRAEQTYIDGFSVTNNESNTQDYLEWFPSISVKYQTEKDLSLYANYKRSIQRPDFQNLNPFTFYLNDFTRVVGNPALQPVFIDHYTLGSALTSFLTIEMYYKNLEGNIFEIPIQDNVNNTVTYTPLNFNQTEEYGLDLITYFNVTDHWFMYAVTSFYKSEDQINLFNGLQSQSQWSNYSILSNSWSFLKDNSLKADLSLVYASKYIQGFMIVEDRLMSDLAISKTFLKKNLVISLSASDLFNLADYETSTQYANQNSTYNTNQDNRWVKLGLRYKIGNTKLQTNERSSGSQETERIEDLD